jgi:uncharacterized protein YceH (UPF0502 family)
VIRNPELNQLHYALKELLNKMPGNTEERFAINQLIAACLTLTNILDALNERESNNVQDLQQQIRALREDVAHLQTRLNT